MKPLPVFILTLALLMGCQSEPTYTDNGNPGQIKAVVFYDDNQNGTMDSDETGALIEVGISQDISCPPQSWDTVTRAATGTDGEAHFKDLAPGKYCVAPFGPVSMTTKMTHEVYVSSDATTTVLFGLAGE